VLYSPTFLCWFIFGCSCISHTHAYTSCCSECRACFDCNGRPVQGAHGRSSRSTICAQCNMWHTHVLILGPFLCRIAFSIQDEASHVSSARPCHQTTIMAEFINDCKCIVTLAVCINRAVLLHLLHCSLCCRDTELYLSSLVNYWLDW